MALEFAHILPFPLVLCQLAVQFEVRIFVAEVGADAGNSIVDGVVGKRLGEVGEDGEVRDALEGCGEVRGEFLVDFGCAGFEEEFYFGGRGVMAAVLGGGFGILVRLRLGGGLRGGGLRSVGGCLSITGWEPIIA